MVQIVLVVREPGRLTPDYSLPFEVPEVPAVGAYVSVSRPDLLEPYSEDVIVRQVWWRLKTQETGTVTSDYGPTGSVTEIFVECDMVVGPYSSDQWRDYAEARRRAGDDIPDMQIARISIRQDQLGGKSSG